MKKNLILSSLIFIAGISFAFLVIIKEKKQNSANSQKNTNQINVNKEAVSQPQDQTMILFYGDGCPHCKNVEEWLKQNEAEKKLSLEKKEIYHNKNNQQELQKKAQECQINSNSIGVPFLWTKEKCLIGDKPIIDFLSSKIN